MASLINVTSIDSEFPVLGQDNPSQGFRNNFTAMKNNFSYAYNEISALQRDAVSKSVGGAVITNDLSKVTLLGAETRNFRETIVDAGVISADRAVAMDYSAGALHAITVSANITSLSVLNWATSGTHARMRVLLVVTGAFAITLAEGHVWTNSITTLQLTTGTYLLEFSTKDAGDNIYVVDLFRNTKDTVKYIVANLSASSNVTVSSASSVVILDTLGGAAIITGANITLSSNVSLADGQTLTITSNAGITHANIFAGANTTVMHGLTDSTWAAGTGNSWIYQSSTATWFRK